MRKIDQVLLTMKASGITKKQYAVLEQVLTEVYCPALIEIEDPDILEKYLAYLRYKNYSKDTIINYEAKLIRLSEFSSNRFIEMTRDDLQEFLQTLCDLKASTLNGYISSFKSFFSWMYRNDYTSEDVSAKIERVKSQTVVEDAFSAVEIEHLREHCDEICREDKNHRNRAMIEFMLSTMCRVSELTNIKIRDVNFSNRSVKVLGKGNKERIVLYDAISEEYLKRYLATRTYTEDDYLFVHLRTNEKLGRSGVKYLIYKLAKLTDLKAHPHKFRRTGASEKSRRGASPLSLKELMGHSNLSTTSRYIVADAETVRADFVRAS